MILESGLRVPEDMAVIGCGNLHYDDVLQVPLSSVDPVLYAGVARPAP